jgi:hypothetical protein
MHHLYAKQSREVKRPVAMSRGVGSGAGWP